MPVETTTPQPIQVPHRYLCPIGLTLMNNPMRTRCGHILDEVSLNNWLNRCEQMSQQKTCPCCRSELLTPQDVSPDLALQQEINNYTRNNSSVLSTHASTTAADIARDAIAAENEEDEDEYIEVDFTNTAVAAITISSLFGEMSRITVLSNVILSSKNAANNFTNLEDSVELAQLSRIYIRLGGTKEELNTAIFEGFMASCADSTTTGLRLFFAHNYSPPRSDIGIQLLRDSIRVIVDKACVDQPVASLSVEFAHNHSLVQRGVRF